MWDFELIADLVEQGLRRENRRRDAEQSPLGVDALDELGHHPLIRAAIGAGDFGVLAEQRYPAAAARRRRSEGLRCDIVVTASRGERITDPLLEATLFDAGNAVEPEDALWLEVKVVGQFAMLDGVPRANPAYAPVLLGDAAADIRKLSRDERILAAGVLVVLYTADEATAAHDLRAWSARMIESAQPVSAPIVRGFAITDRIGNAWCAVAVAQVHGL